MKHMRNISNFYGKAHFTHNLAANYKYFLAGKVIIIIISNNGQLVGFNNKFFITECKRGSIGEGSCDSGSP